MAKMNLRRAALPAAALALVLAAVGLGAALLRPRPVFLVEAGFAPALRAAAAVPGAPGWTIAEFDPRTGPPAGGRRYGFIISTVAESGEGGGAAGVKSSGEKSPESGKDGGAAGMTMSGEAATAVPAGPPRVHRDLQRRGGGDSGFPLALDPWLVFRRHSLDPPTRERLEARGGAGGFPLLAGGDPEAVRAWAAQDLQERPGVFPSAPEVWQERMRLLPRDGRFQRGALTYTWEDVWPRLFGPESAWVYAPLSRLQALPGSRTSLLEGRRFPDRQGWNEYGIQARILWALPLGGRTGRRDVQAAAEWLRRADTQTLIAGALKWAPAHGAARPVNPLALAAQREWLGSSYVWEAR